MKQLLLELAEAPAPTLDNYVPGRNAAALAALREAATAPEPGAVIYLFGEPGSGKTHLLRAVHSAWLAQGREFKNIASDDVHRLDAEGQGELFDAFNAMRAAGGSFLATGDVSPREVALREDLRTRLASGLTFQLHALSDAEKADALRRHAAGRGIRLGDEVIAYVLSHVRRDMGTLVAVLDAVDRYSLAAKRPITLPLVREALQTL